MKRQRIFPKVADLKFLVYAGLYDFNLIGIKEIDSLFLFCVQNAPCRLFSLMKEMYRVCSGQIKSPCLEVSLSHV